MNAAPSFADVVFALMNGGSTYDSMLGEIDRGHEAEAKQRARFIDARERAIARLDVLAETMEPCEAKAVLEITKDLEAATWREEIDGILERLPSDAWAFDVADIITEEIR